METVLSRETPLAAYLEGEGQFDPTTDDEDLHDDRHSDGHPPQTPFAPQPTYARLLKRLPKPTTPHIPTKPLGRVQQLHHAWSSAWNSRLGRADNTRFLEHFRYTIVASQLLNEYLDQGALPPPSAPGLGISLDGTPDHAPANPIATSSLYGAGLTAAVAFALVYLIHWGRSSHDGGISKSRIVLVLLVFLLIFIAGYAYVRRQWLKFLRWNAVTQVTNLTANWQSFEVSASSALSLIQEVELVSRGYRLSSPLGPASRIEDHGANRRCLRLRQCLHKAYSTLLPTCVHACTILRDFIDKDDLERYSEVYNLHPADIADALNADSSTPSPEDDLDSLKSLRVLSFRASILRRLTLSTLMSLEADGGKPDFARWRLATDAMKLITDTALGPSADKIQHILRDMEVLTLPTSPSPSRPQTSAAREKLRSQVRKISTLSAGIKTLQAKMQVLREESNRSIELSEDPTDLGPSLMAQYESIGEDLKELMQAWEAGKASLQSNLTKHENRLSSLASSPRSVVSSIGGLTAVEEDSGSSAGLAAALKALTGDPFSPSNRSSLGTGTTSDEEVFEAVAMPRQRSPLTREERIGRMREERERQAVLRAKRDANTNMLRELESVIHLRPKRREGGMRVTSM
ncbi:Mysoin-binding motif of peroxisomes-domain-containing protein [Neohortaea acidophila]|uniref:Vezatin n=1 Tax=Neohortaea acidophila TaxID=245834 RepID=A0A6A6PRH6_9PEZI|nr:Mysoin-binding motif of peroxisomes-domain-containing protein [Neohortaea acidophila]KAF2482271.1 Mysoin-binding motif of peroxisomes-domain-containing protein [Neohortaea acidophila]